MHTAWLTYHLFSVDLFVIYYSIIYRVKIRSAVHWIIYTHKQGHTCSSIFCLSGHSDCILTVTLLLFIDFFYPTASSRSQFGGQSSPLGRWLHVPATGLVKLTIKVVRGKCLCQWLVIGVTEIRNPEIDRNLNPTDTIVCMWSSQLTLGMKIMKYYTGLVQSTACGTQTLCFQFFFQVDVKT